MSAPPVPLDQRLLRMSNPSPPVFTEKQGQYLAFIRAYRLLHDRAPAEAEFERFFRVTPPTVHSMILQLERRSLISRVPGKSRSIELTISHDGLPSLQDQSIKTSVARY